MWSEVLKTLMNFLFTFSVFYIINALLTWLTALHLFQDH